MRPLSDYDFDKEIEVNDNVVVEDENEELSEGSTSYAEGEVKEVSCNDSRCKHLKVAVTIFAIVLFVYGVASSIQLYRYNHQIKQYSMTVNRLEDEVSSQIKETKQLEKELKSVCDKNEDLSKTVKSQKKKIANLKKQNEELSEKVKQSTSYSSSTSYFKSSDLSSTSSGEYSPSYFRNAGDINWNGWRWTWYSQKVLPGPGLNIPGRHVDNQYVCDGDGYICLANDVYELGQVISTPFGKQGKVYDRITDDRSNTTTVDVYTNF